MRCSLAHFVVDDVFIRFLIPLMYSIHSTFIPHFLRFFQISFISGGAMVLPRTVYSGTYVLDYVRSTYSLPNV
jgi:hypothetical protein